MMVERCIALTDRRAWETALVGCPHAFAHTWGSAYAAWLSTGDNTFLYTAEKDGTRILCPVAERVWEGYTDIYTPYGFSGFVGTAPHPAFASTWSRFVARQQYVCGYFGLNPILNSAEYFDATVVRAYNSVYVLDLTRPKEQLFADLHTNRRRELAQFDIDSPAFMTERAALGDFFLSTYSQFYRERSASPVYNFAPETLRTLFSLENVFLVGAVGAGQVQAVSVFAYTPSIGEYLFNVSVPEGRRYSASLVWFGLNRLRTLGVAFLNLGGGVNSGDGVAGFKERFGAERLPLKSAREVYRPDVYQKLCQEAGQDPDDHSGYFPAYRRHRSGD